MARVAEGWRLVWRRGIAGVRFRIDGERQEVSTGTRDPVVAAQRASRIYAEAVSGRRRRVEPHAARNALEQCVAEWVESLDATVHESTAREYAIYARAHWLTRWATLGEITEASLGDYQRERLRAVTRTTLRKELSALRGLLRWCREAGYLRDVPSPPELPRQAMGRRTRPATKREPLTPDDVERLLRLLPEWSRPAKTKVGRPRFRVRDYYRVLWETGLRPATVHRLRAPEHYVHGAEVLRLDAASDKARFARELPLTPGARAALDRLSPRGHVGPLCGGHDHRPWLAIAAKKLGRPVTEYDLRHSRITHWVGSGDLLGVQYLAGHKHLSTTARYAHASREAAQRVLAGDKHGGRR